MSELEECYQLFCIACERGETLKSFALTPSQGLALAAEVAGSMVWPTGKDITVEEWYEGMLKGNVELYGVRVAIAQ